MLLNCKVARLIFSLLKIYGKKVQYLVEAVIVCKKFLLT
jgi:hypothetical protein